MVQISTTPHRLPEVRLSLVNYLDKVEQRRRSKTLESDMAVKGMEETKRLQSGVQNTMSWSYMLQDNK